MDAFDNSCNNAIAKLSVNEMEQRDANLITSG